MNYATEWGFILLYCCAEEGPWMIWYLCSKSENFHVYTDLNLKSGTRKKIEESTSGKYTGCIAHVILSGWLNNAA